MTKYAVLGHEVHVFKGQTSEQAWFEAKLGAEPFAVVPRKGGLSIVSVEPLGGIDMQYPLIILPAGVAIELPIGVKPGAFIGMTNMEDPEKGGLVQAFVFRGAPWPTTVLEGRAVEGTA